MERTSTAVAKSQEKAKLEFKSLPPELRIMIWGFAMPEARTLVIKSPYSRQTVPVSLDKALPSGHDGDETWHSPAKVPALLHVNAEARHEALKRYSLSLGVGQMNPRVYVDFDRDTLFFGESEFAPDCFRLWTKTKDFEKLQRLALIPETAWRALQWTKAVDLASLQTLIFAHNAEKIKSGCLPQLVEDKLSGAKIDFRLGLKQQVQQLEAQSAVKERIQAARDEIETLESVLPEGWQKQVAVVTAVFKETSS